MSDELDYLFKENNDLDKLSQELSNQISSQSRKQDDRFWYPANDDAGEGGAIIRFLPRPPKESSPLVRLWKYRFKGPSGAWYSENSLRTIGLPDPCAEYNSQLWDTGDEGNRNQARDQKRKLTIISNILVIKDPLNPENEGKVFLYRYGKKIWDMIERAMKPLDPNDPEVKEKIDEGLIDESEIRPKFDPFDVLKGANFRVKFKTVGGFRNYDDSKFLKNEPLFAGDKEKIKEVVRQEYSLEEFVSPDKFKSYDELKLKLNQVLGLDQQEAPGNWELPEEETTVASVNKDGKFKEAPAPSSPEMTVEDDDLDLDFLNDLDDEAAA